MLARRLLLAAVIGSVACEPDALHVQPDPPDSGVEPAPDATPAPDAAASDAAALPDASPPAPDAGFPDATPPAREPIYIQTGAELYSYQADTNRAVQIAPFHTSDGTPITDMADIAIDLRGQMIGGTVSRVVYSIDPLTAVCQRRFSFADMLHGLTFLSDGTLVVAGARVSLVDPVSGQVQRVLVSGTQYQTSGDIVGLPDGNLYWTVRGGANMGDDVIRIDPRSGATQLLSATDVTRIYGLGYADGTLYGFSADGKVVVIDAANGDVTAERTLSSAWWGATTNPVLWH